MTSVSVGEHETVRVDAPSSVSSRFRGRQGAVPTPWITTGIAVVALLVWVTSLPSVEVRRTGGWGLLSGLPAAWYVAYALALAAFLLGLVTGMTGASGTVPRHTKASTAGAAAVLLLILLATTSLVYDAPRYTWTYKHIGVTEYLIAHKAPAVDVDIYQNFPGFFYLMALFHEVTRIPLTVMARFAEFFSNAVNAVALYWALGAITRDYRVRAVTVALFTLANWIGQTYFAPQALAFPASLLLVGAFLRLVAAQHGRPHTSRTWEQLLPGSRFWSRPEAWLLCVEIYAVIVVSHQLTPAVALLQVGLLTLLFRLRRPWLVLVLVAVEVGWILHAYPYISQHFSLFQRAKYENIRPPAALAPVLPGAGVMAQVPHAITLLVVLGTLAGAARVIRRTRSVRTLLVPGVLAVAPALLVIVQPYGQEGILRVYLFALPWCCLVIARDLLGVGVGASTRAPPARRIRLKVLASVAVVGTFGVLAAPATFGNELVSHVYGADVATDAYFERSTPRGSELLLLVPAFPSRSTASYASHLLEEDPSAPSLQVVSGFRRSTRSARALVRFTEHYVNKSAAQHDTYLALGPTQEAYIKAYGLMSQATYRGYIKRLERIKRFHLVYHSRGGYLFKLS